MATMGEQNGCGFATGRDGAVRETTTTMTVYKVEAELMDVSTVGQEPGSMLLVGTVLAYARCGGNEHTWPVTPGRCWPGDKVTITLYMDDDPTESTEQTPPPLDLREGH